MIINFFKISLSILIISISVYAQVRETRAVWVTTNFKLDWPPNTFDENVQKESLYRIFENLSQRHFNTVYFQVRSNGTVLYKSDIEPFSPYITGDLNVEPGYDPLQYAIDLGKKFNIEVHAWVNMMRCFSGSDDIFLRHPKHIRNTHPNYTIRVMDNGKLSYWMNPGFYKVQDYLVNILNEIVSNYDVDGIHLDFFRYPSKQFEDEKYFSNYGLNVSLGDWRRNNLTTILRKFKDSLKSINPYLKVGVTPIGIRKSLKDANGWEGYSSVFQDTEEWLKEGLVDYLTPQIYWDFEKNPKFDVLAKDWVQKSYSRNIILGLAAYKEDVKLELHDMVKIAREIGAAGVSFFRYNNISSKSDKYFSNISMPSNMLWKIKPNQEPDTNIYSAYKSLSEDKVIISWFDRETENKNYSRTYLLLGDDKPQKFLSLDKNKVKLKFGNPSKLMYKYQINKLDRLWNFNSISNPLAVIVPFLQVLKQSAYFNSDLILYKKNEYQAYLSITSDTNQSALIGFINKENLKKQIITNLKLGINIVLIDESLKILKKIVVTYDKTNRKEELNFY